MTVPVEKLDRYFLSPLDDSISSPISSHLEAVDEYLSGTFTTDPIVFTHLYKSVQKVAKSADPFVAHKVNETCQHIRSTKNVGPLVFGA